MSDVWALVIERQACLLAIRAWKESMQLPCGRGGVGLIHRRQGRYVGDIRALSTAMKVLEVIVVSSFVRYVVLQYALDPQSPRFVEVV